MLISTFLHFGHLFMSSPDFFPHSPHYQFGSVVLFRPMVRMATTHGLPFFDSWPRKISIELLGSDPLKTNISKKLGGTPIWMVYNGSKHFPTLLKWMIWGFYPYLGGGNSTVFFYCSPRKFGEDFPPFWRRYFSDGLVKNHQLDSYWVVFFAMGFLTEIIFASCCYVFAQHVPFLQWMWVIRRYLWILYKQAIVCYNIYIYTLCRRDRFKNIYIYMQVLGVARMFNPAELSISGRMCRADWEEITCLLTLASLKVSIQRAGRWFLLIIARVNIKIGTSLQVILQPSSTRIQFLPA